MSFREQVVIIQLNLLQTWENAQIHQTAQSADRKSTRLNSSHSQISYAVFCLKKKKKASITVTYYILVCRKNLHDMTPMSYAVADHYCWSDSNAYLQHGQTTTHQH